MDEERLVKRKQKAKRDANVNQLAQLSKELGDMYFETGRLKDALLEYNDQLFACEVLQETLNCAIAHRMIGEVYMGLGEYEEALIHLNLHLEGAKKTKDTLEQQRAMATIGRTHFCRGQAFSEESVERQVAFAAAEMAYSESLMLCNKLEKTNIKLTEIITMKARLLLNLGLVLEGQKQSQQAVEKIEEAVELCTKHKLMEDLHRAHIALGEVHEHQGHLGLALKHVDKAIEIGDSSIKADGRLTKAELLLQLGHWFEARQILVMLYLTKNLSQTTSQQVQRLLRIVVTICRAEESLEVESERKIHQGLYETLGDACVAVRSYDKALGYYQKMLSCADKEGTIESISAALVSLVQTYRDTLRYKEALPYARRELSICTEPSEICRSALNLADLLHRTEATKFEVMEIYDLAKRNARKCDNRSLEVPVLKDILVYLKDTGELSKAQKVEEKLAHLSESLVDTASESESEGADIGADICLEDLSDVEAEMKRNDEIPLRKLRSAKRALVVKRNEKGETKLHIACINGNIDEVEKLLEADHPTNVKDHCGWTPLHEAANHGYVEIARLLIKSGVNVNDPGGPMCGGVTPLHDAALCGHFSMMCLLIKEGADLRLKTREGDTVLDCLEDWRSRADELSAMDQVEYDNLHGTLCAILPRNVKKSLTPREPRIFNDLVDKDEDEDRDSDRDIERISAREDYRRTIASLKNRGRLIDSWGKRVSSSPKKVFAPLIDSEEALVDDWLEDDLNSTVRGKTRVEDCLPSTTKRKSSDYTVDVQKNVKRPKIRSDENMERIELVTNDNSCEADSDSSGIIFSHRSVLKIGKKRASRQLSLLKSGFTRDSISRTPSPIFNYNDGRADTFERIEDNTSESVKLQIRIGQKVITVKLRFPEQRETTVASLMNDVIAKYEDETGCKVQITLTTMSGEILLRENTLKRVKPVGGIVRLVADIVEHEIPPIVDRYARICKNHKTESRDTIEKGLKNCDNKSTFHVKSGEIMDGEIIPLLKCLEYQEKLQILNMSGASLYNLGETLNSALKRLTTLQELHLQGSDMDHNCLLRIERLPAQLRIIDLSYNPLGPQCEEKLYRLVCHHRYLQTLNLCFCKLRNFQSSDDWSSLVHLDLSWNPLSDDTASYFLQCQMLSLNLSNTRHTETSPFTREILDCSRPSLTTLETLELACCNLKDSDVLEILTRAVNLSTFVISGNSRVTKKAIEELLRRKPTMSRIDASGCEKIIEMPENEVYIDNPQVCTLIVSMSSTVEEYWRRLWRDTANTHTLPHDIIAFKPILY